RAHALGDGHGHAAHGHGHGAVLVDHGHGHAHDLVDGGGASAGVVDDHAGGRHDLLAALVDGHRHRLVERGDLAELGFVHEALQQLPGAVVDLREREARD